MPPARKRQKGNGPSVPSDKAEPRITRSLKLPSRRESSKLSKPSTIKRGTSPRKLSKLEDLPLELLTAIFLYAKEIHLTDASPIIGARLSSNYIFKQIVTDLDQLDTRGQQRLIQSRFFNIQAVNIHLTPIPKAFKRGLIIPPKLLRQCTDQANELHAWLSRRAGAVIDVKSGDSLEACREGLLAAVRNNSLSKADLILEIPHPILKKHPITQNFCVRSHIPVWYDLIYEAIENTLIHNGSVLLPGLLLIHTLHNIPRLDYHDVRLWKLCTSVKSEKSQCLLDLIRLLINLNDTERKFVIRYHVRDNIKLEEHMRKLRDMDSPDIQVQFSTRRLETKISELCSHRINCKLHVGPAKDELG